MLASGRAEKREAGDRGDDRRLDDGREATPAMFREALAGDMERVRGEVGAKAFEGGRFQGAIALFSDMSLSDTFDEFLTLPASKLID